VIGDSVSIGYTPHVAAKLAGKVQVQHSPSAGGGGADDTPYGAQCILGESAGHTESFLRTARYEPVKWGVILFNFGLHDMETNATGGAHSLANYSAQLTAIAEKLQGTGSKLLYVATTPFMPYTSLGDPIVSKLNAAAKLIMDAKRIPIIDLWGHVVAKCGPVPYSNCSICAREPCSYHYNAAGYDYIAGPLVAAILKAVRYLPLGS
jgi:hypothetical protein